MSSRAPRPPEAYLLEGVSKVSIPPGLHCRDAPWGVSAVERTIQSATIHPHGRLAEPGGYRPGGDAPRGVSTVGEILSCGPPPAPGVLRARLFSAVTGAPFGPAYQVGPLGDSPASRSAGWEIRGLSPIGPRATLPTRPRSSGAPSRSRGARHQRLVHRLCVQRPRGQSTCRVTMPMRAIVPLRKVSGLKPFSPPARRECRDRNS